MLGCKGLIHFFFVLFKGAERKNKDESKSAEKRIQKWVKQNTSSCAGKFNSCGHFDSKHKCFSKCAFTVIAFA